MNIYIISASVYMSKLLYPNRIFAPRDYMISIADGLVDRGHNVTFFTSPGTETKAKIIPGHNDLLNEELVRDKYITYGLTEENKQKSHIESKYMYAIDMISRAYDMADKQNIDIIQTDHHLAHYFVNFTNAKTIFTMHDPMPNKKSIDFLLSNEFKDHNYISISMAQRNKDLLLNYVGNIYHGIKMDDIEPQLEPEDYYIHLGRILPQKGLEFAIEACQISNAKFKIATDKTYLNTEYFKEKISPHINDSSISIIGFIKEKKKKNEFIGKSKGLIMPYKWEEPFGYAMIEAMANGSPVIAYNRGSVSEVIKDGVSGFIVNDVDQDTPTIIKNKGVDGLVEAINRINEIDRAECRKYAEIKFSVDKMVENYENIYQQLSI